ncbi:hypothetical protein IMAU10572_00899 [Lactiplantibacillus plantarum]|nr:hypothetical protein [Lactiplantibacillus plantarum]
MVKSSFVAKTCANLTAASYSATCCDCNCVIIVADAGLVVGIWRYIPLMCKHNPLNTLLVNGRANNRSQSGCQSLTILIISGATICAKFCVLDARCWTILGFITDGDCSTDLGTWTLRGRVPGSTCCRLACNESELKPEDDLAANDKSAAANTAANSC